MTAESLRQRLERLSDDELLEIFRKHDSGEWQPAVFPLVEDILRSRGVEIGRPLESPGYEGVLPEEQRFVTVARFATVVEAEACRSALLAAGFRVVGQDECLLRLDPALGPALGGFRLAVPASEADDARSYLAAAESGALGAGLLECGRCGSGDVASERKASRGGTFLNTFIVGPVVQDVTISFRCRTCGATWE